jgi:hypothetical protein
MATFNYSRSQNTADRLIKKFGQRGHLMRYVAPLTSRDRPTYTPVPINMAVLDYDKGQIDGTRILATDKLIYVSAKGLTVEIDPNDRIRDRRGVSYQIVPPLRPLDPSSEVVVYYELQGRV